MQLFVYGDLVIDVCLRIDRWAGAGSDAIVNAAALLPGGSAANCAAVAARLGASVAFIGVVGRDALGQSAIDDLRKAGVDTRWLHQVEQTTGVVVAVIDDAGEHTFLSYRGANDSLLTDDRLPASFHADDYLHLSGYSFQTEASRMVALRLLAKARAGGARISLDPSFHFAGSPDARNLLADLDFFFPNWTEARQLTQADTPQTAAAFLRAHGVNTVVIKLGADGCYLDSPDEQRLIPAYPAAHIVDTVGAGDAFCGGFLTAVGWGLPPVQAAHLGHAAAARVITQAGGHVGAPTLAGAIEWMRANGDSDLASRLTAYVRYDQPKTSP